MKPLKSLSTIVLVTSFLFGCQKQEPQTTAKVDGSPITTKFTPPEISYEGRTPIGEKVDPATISPENNGYLLDMDGDGVVDLVILRGTTLYYTKQAVNTQYTEIPILSIKGNIIAYMVQLEPSTNGKAVPVLHFWNDQRDGFLQRCLGTNDSGIPFFGDVESE